VVVGGDHGDTAFQFSASISVELNDARIIDFEVSVCELICRKDTGKLIEQTILPRLTNGLEVVATLPLHIETDKHGLLQCRFSRTAPVGNRSTPPKVEVYITGDLAFQAMVLGKESMSTWWCMQFKGSRHPFLNDCEIWTMQELVIRSTEAETKKRRTNAWAETKAVVAIHNSLQLHDPTPPLLNRNRKSNVREIARHYQRIH
jgi:hypothetical protein